MSEATRIRPSTTPTPKATTSAKTPDRPKPTKTPVPKAPDRATLSRQTKEQSTASSTQLRGLNQNFGKLFQESGKVVSDNTSWYGNLDEENVGRTLASRTDLVNPTLDRLGATDLDDVSKATAANMTDQQVAATDRGTLKRMTREMNSGAVSDDESRQIQRLAAVTNPDHARVLDDSVAPGVQQAMKDNNLTQQRIQDGGGTVNLDEYSLTVDRMPPGVTPEQYLDRIARDPNGAAKSSTFDFMASFSRRRDQSRSPQPGDIYDINMGGIKGTEGGDNGSVIMRDLQPDRFTVSTVTDNNWLGEGEHPVYGNREFGYRANEDGSTTFYTRAADRRTDGYGNTPGINGAVEWGQDNTWRSFMDGISRDIEGSGGRVRPGSITARTWQAGD